MRGALAIASLALVLAGHACAASPPPPPAPVEHLPPEEQRCEELARRLDALVSERAAQAPDDVALAEAQEIGRVADELCAEGDFPTAEMLFEEAIALLEGAEPSS